MRIFSLSDASYQSLLADYPEGVRRININHLSSELCSSSESAIVAGEISQIDNQLADRIHAAAAEGISVGIVPYDSRYPESFRRLLEPSNGVQEGTARIGLYSSRGLQFDFGRSAATSFTGNIVKLKRKSENEGRNTSPEDAALQITQHDFTALGIVTEGRQTYCLVGMGCLHPTISASELGRLAPANIRARHWLLQSCHSPFVWPELGSYLTVPLSIALTGGAESVICSTHVQTYVPDLLDLYLEMASRGLPMGRIVRALNDHSVSQGVDYRPFMLLGNPDSKAIVADHRQFRTELASFSSARSTKKIIGTVRRLISNVNFVSDPDSFGFDKKNDAFVQFRRDIAWLPRVDMRSLSRFADSAHEVEKLIDRMRPPNEQVPLKIATERLSEAWETQGGFYAVGEQLDENYSTEGARQTEDRCQICCEKLIERKLSYFGQSPSAEYSERCQIVCPRCLVVEHVSPVHRRSTQVTAKRTAHELSVSLSYTNATSETQWVFAFAFLSDPNNVSRSTAGTAYKQLLERTANRRAQQDPTSLEPGQTFEFGFSTGPVPDDFWYLLLEVNLMVDFCWNWFSFTFREKRIEKWLSSPQYPSTLPRVKPVIDGSSGDGVSSELLT
jgi:hypothetical protein